MSGPGEPGQPGVFRPAPVAVPPELLTARHRRSSVALTVILWVLMVLGAGVMALVLLASSAPGAIVVGTLLAVIPVGPVIAAFLWLDRYEPEPVKVLAAAFAWGALVATAAALILQALGQFVLGTPETFAAAVVAPVTEEAAKGLFVALLVWLRRHVIDGILDGIVYAGMIGVGFAFTENILYIGAAYMGADDLGEGGLGSAVGLFVVRGIFSPFAHPLFTAFIGLGVGYAAVRHSAAARVLAPLAGYVVAVLLHAIWNGSAFIGGGEAFVLTYLFLMVPGFVMLAGFAIWARAREGTVLTRALTDAAARGFLAHAEVPWLVRLPARRVSRSHARRVGGPLAARVMREYQQQAVELGFLHDRYLRGTAPADFAERGTVMVRRLDALRPYVLFPQPVGTPTTTPWEGSR